MNRNAKKLHKIKQWAKTFVLRSIKAKRKLTKADWNKREL